MRTWQRLPRGDILQVDEVSDGAGDESGQMVFKECELAADEGKQG